MTSPSYLRLLPSTSALAGVPEPRPKPERVPLGTLLHSTQLCLCRACSMARHPSAGLGPDARRPHAP